MLHYLITLAILSVFIDNKQPKFEEQTVDDKVSIGYGIALGDVDGDQKTDILLADKKQFVCIYQYHNQFEYGFFY